MTKPAPSATKSATRRSRKAITRLPRGVIPANAFHETPSVNEEAAYLADAFAGQSYHTHVIPPDLCGRDERELWDRMCGRVLLGLPPANPVDALLRAVMEELSTIRGGDSVSPDVVITAVRLAIAQSHGVRIRTQARDIARHHGVKYKTLLDLRKLARRQLAALGVRLDLPAWLRLDYG
jgi:hypothetical protein